MFLPFGKSGQERLGSANLSIAVDPRDSARVYIAWGDQPSGTTNMTVHVRRSIDSGANWSMSDLVTAANAVNPALAINSHGRVALVYQQVTGSNWETHLVRSSDADALTFDTPGIILHTAPTATPAATSPVYLGDYLHITSYGRDFYGIFSGSNVPNNANFPSGVTYRRFANFATNTLFANAAMSITVAPSIDPFFFHSTEIAADTDYYVRDWTDSASSGDNGAEPSTHPFFYTTSDVWNRRGPTAGTFVNDQPPNEDAGNGIGAIGDNWAFARIRRNAAGSGPTTVSAHFLVSRFGTGSAYVDNTMPVAMTGVDMQDPDPPVQFTAGSAGPITTPEYHWRLDETMSTHLCLAVQLTAPGDDFIAPSLVNLTPGWPATDLNVLNDNNKAQRNMHLSTLPSHGSLGSMADFGLVHNIAPQIRDIRLRLGADPATLRRLGEVTVEMPGRDRQRFRPGQTIVLERMQPGENRWVGVSFAAPAGNDGDVLPVYFDEIDAAGRPISGVAIGARVASADRAAADALDNHRIIFTRAGALLRVPSAKEEVNAADALLRRGDTSAKRYLSFLEAHLDALTAIAALDAKSGGRFGTAADVAALRTALASHDADLAVTAHISLLNRLDAMLTAQQLDRGDPADIIQTLRWQRQLLRSDPRFAKSTCAAHVIDATATYVDAVGHRRRTLYDYPAVMREQLDCLSGLAHDAGLDALAHDLATATTGDVASLQHAHRALLLKLQQP